MRFLFVYETCASKARSLISELLLTDVELVIARRDESKAGDAVLEILRAHRGAEAAACGLNRKYRRSVQGYVTFTVEPKKFRFEDQLLRQWLVGGNDESDQGEPASPRDAFTRAEALTPCLLLSESALDLADDVDPSRWPFIARSADLLSRLAADDPQLGPLRNWEQQFGISFAANGQVGFSYSVEVGGDRWSSVTYWHLKAGDRTWPSNAPRIYFASTTLAAKRLVLVAYVGPHPRNGTMSVDFGRFDVVGDTLVER